LVGRCRRTAIDSICRRHEEELKVARRALQETDAAIKAIRRWFQEKLAAMKHRFAREKHQIEERAAAEVKRLRDLNRAHRESIAFDRLPQLTAAEYEEIRSFPPTELPLIRFLSMQLYELMDDLRRSAAKSDRERSDEIQKLQLRLTAANTDLVAERELRLSLEAKLDERIPPKPDFPDLSSRVLELESQTADLRAAHRRALTKLAMLASRVKELTVANRELAAEIEALRRRLVESSREIAELRTQIEAVGKPQRVLVTMLGERHREVEELRGKVAALDELAAELTRKSNACGMNSSKRFDQYGEPVANPEPFVIPRRSA
jgi:hypothetical protein